MQQAIVSHEPVRQLGPARGVPASLVIDVLCCEFDSIESIIVDAVVGGRCDPTVGRGLLYAAATHAPLDAHPGSFEGGFVGRPGYFAHLPEGA